MKVHLNGQLVSADEARVSPFDAGYLYGDGLFDTLRAYAGYPYLLEEHLHRLAREAELLQLPFDVNPIPWRGHIQDLLAANGLKTMDARVRIQISRGGGPDIDQVTVDPDSVESTIFITARRVSERVDAIQRDGIRLLAMQSTFARGNFPQIKSLNYLPSIMALRFARAQGFEEACLFNRQNKLLEGATSNVFLVSGGVLRTPSPRLGLLPGITRSRVMSLGRDLGLKVEEAASDLRDMVVADEMFLTGSVKEIVPVIALDNSMIGDGTPGRWTRRLQEAYREAVASSRGAAAAEG